MTRNVPVIGLRGLKNGDRASMGAYTSVTPRSSFGTQWTRRRFTRYCRITHNLNHYNEWKVEAGYCHLIVVVVFHHPRFRNSAQRTDNASGHHHHLIIIIIIKRDDSSDPTSCSSATTTATDEWHLQRPRCVGGGDMCFGI
jgi:hypothetical protein